MQHFKLLVLSGVFVLIGAGCNGPTIVEEPLTVPTPAPAEEPAELGVTSDVETIVDNGITMQVPAPGSDAPEMIVEEAEHAPSNLLTFDGKNYDISNLTVRVGDTVTWKNDSKKKFWPASNVHPSHTILPEFDALRPMAGGTSYSFTFTEKGTWRWHDHLRANKGGRVTVQ